MDIYGIMLIILGALMLALCLSFFFHARTGDILLLIGVYLVLMFL